ncbi:MAG: hypothetical protein IH972_05185 [Candidatus Marinimicrobia bacterium]|nr:hypothetical protein [Candidatus Neomarinimicrobiota bacterium]
MKTILRAILLVSVSTSFALGQSAALAPAPDGGGGGGDGPGLVLAADFVILIGKVKTHDSGNIKSVLGLSPLMGISYKKYFGDGAAAGSFNGYWAIGTDLLLLPFLGIGGDYIFDGNTQFYIGANVTSHLVLLFLPIPSLSLGVYL